MADENSDSDQEMFPVRFQESNQDFLYEDPLLVSGILKAVVERDLDKVKKLVSEGKSVNINDNHGNTPLHVAVIRNLSEIVDYLIALEDSIINSRNFYGETPLFQAIERDHFDLARKLIKAKCNVNLSNFDDVTPLHLSVTHPEITKLLIDNGANINAIDYSGETPLHKAVTGKCTECVYMLLYYNADPNIECDNNLTPFMKSIILESVEIQSTLLDYVVDFNKATKDGMTVLNLALTRTCPYVKEIIDKGADVNYEHDIFNAFVLCLLVPNVDNFRLVWKDFKYQQLFTEMSYLEFLLYYLDGLDLHEYLHVIIDSGNLNPLINDFSFTPFYNFLKNRVPGRSAWLELTAKFVCVYLTHGYGLKSKTIDQIYELYGYCSLLSICLHMDIEFENSALTEMSAVFYIPRLTVDEFKILIKEQFNLRLTAFLPYIRIPCMNVGPLDPNSEWGANQEMLIKEVDILSRLPSLLELARNATRDYIVNKFELNSSREYHTFIREMPIHNVCKDILSFRRPVYLV